MEYEMEDFFNSCNEIHNLACDLHDLSSAFYQTGNQKMGDTLDWKANQLLESVKVIRDYHGQMLGERLRDAQATSDAVFAGVMSLVCKVKEFN